MAGAILCLSLGDRIISLQQSSSAHEQKTGPAGLVKGGEVGFAEMCTGGRRLHAESQCPTRMPDLGAGGGVEEAAQVRPQIADGGVPEQVPLGAPVLTSGVWVLHGG